MHHVFEHFERAEALALLVRLHDWLEPRGRLVLETPDFDRCIAGWAERSFEDQALILRHMFGSQEAPWARHLDGWGAARFRYVLERLGYSDLEVTEGVSDARGLLANVTVRASKLPDGSGRREREARAREILKMSMNGDGPSELGLLARWEDRLAELLSADHDSLRLFARPAR